MARPGNPRRAGFYASGVIEASIRDREWVAAQIAEGTSVTALAEAAGVSRQTVYTWLARHGLDVGNTKARPSPDDLRSLYAEHGSVRRVAEHLDVGADTARRWLIDAKVELASVGRPASTLDLDELRRRRAAGASFAELAAGTGVDPETVRRHLADP